MTENARKPSVAQFLPAAAGWCVAGLASDADTHCPVMAWAVMDDERGNIGPSIVPVYVDHTPRVLDPRRSSWRDDEVVVHRVEECNLATDKVLRQRLYTADVRQFAAVPE